MKLKTLLVVGVAALVTLATVAINAFELNDSAQPPKWGQLPLPTNRIATVGFTNSAKGTAPIAVMPGVLLIQVSCYSTQASTSNVVFKARTTLDGNVWTDSPLISSGTFTLNGTATNTIILTVGTNIQARFVSFDAATSAELASVFVQDAKFAFVPTLGP